MDIIERQLRNIIIGYIEPLTAEQKLEAGTVLEKILEEIKESGNLSHKRKYMKIDESVAIKVFNFVKDNPEATYSEIEDSCGLSKNLIKTYKKQVLSGLTLKQIVNLSRTGINRFDSACTIGEVAQMGISSKYSNEY